jgi:DNA polymerase-1
MRRHKTIRKSEKIIRRELIEKDAVLHRLLDAIDTVQTQLAEPAIVDKKVLKKLEHKLRGLLVRKNKKIESIRKKSTFKFKSVAHMRVLLFRVMGLRPLGRTSTGASTNAATLKFYAYKGGIITTLLAYRKIFKQLGTYVKPITQGCVVKADGKIHANYLLHGTETGRLSCGSKGSGQGADAILDKYNMQNLPRKGPIRGLFISDFQDEDGRLIAADFKQGEFVLMGVIAKEQAIIDAANAGVDLHKNSAALTYGISYDEVTDDQRTIVKSGVSFGLIYGRSAFALGKQFGWSQRRAEKFVKKFFSAFPRIPIYHLEAKHQALNYGYVESPFGLRRRLAQIRSNDQKARGHAERAAVNFPVQNALAYCTIIAINRLSVALKELGLRAKLVATVHDSIVIDAPGNEIELVKALMYDVMENLGLSWLNAALKIDITVSKTLEK